jgi:hypothetical protein
MRSMIVAGLLAAASPSAFAFGGCIRLPVQAPTLSELGLGVLVVIVAAAAGWAIRRKK